MEYAFVVEEVSKVDASFGIAFYVTTSLYAGSVWNSDATEEQKKALFPITYRPFSCIRSKHKSGIMKVKIMIALLYHVGFI